MEKKGATRFQILDLLQEKGGARPGVAKEVHRETGVPEADVHGVATFYSLLRRPGDRFRVCQGLSCQLAGAEDRAEELREAAQNESDPELREKLWDEYRKYKKTTN